MAWYCQTINSKFNIVLDYNKMNMTGLVYHGLSNKIISIIKDLRLTGSHDSGVYWAHNHVDVISGSKQAMARHHAIIVILITIKQQSKYDSFTISYEHETICYASQSLHSKACTKRTYNETSYHARGTETNLCAGLLLFMFLILPMLARKPGLCITYFMVVFWMWRAM